MNVWKKMTLKSLRLNKKRTVVTIIGIILSVAMLTAVASMFFSARTSLIKYETEEKGNYHYSFFHVSREEAEELKQHRKVEKIFYTNEVGYAPLEGSTNEYKPYLYIQAYDKEAMENLGIRLLSGRLPENEQEILISSHIYSNGNVKYNVGDRICLEVGKRISEGYLLDQTNAYEPETEEEITNADIMEFTIVGEMGRPPVGVEPYSAPGYTCVTCLTEESKSEYVNVYLRYDEDGLKEHSALTAGILGVDAEAFTVLNDDAAFFQLSAEEQNNIMEKTANTKYQYTCNNYLITLETGILGDSTLQALAAAGGIVLLIIILTSVFCIRNSFDISITEKIRQYGMLSSIGATKRQIRKNVYYEAFLLGICGIPLGLLAGNGAAAALILISNHLLEGNLNVELVFDLSLPALFLATLLGVVTIFLSARKSAVKAAKISPIQAIRNSEELEISPKKIRTPGWVKKIFGIGGEISYKNLKRSRKKYRTTVASISICVMVFIVLYSFLSLAFDVIETEYENLGYTLSIEYETDGTDHYSETLRNLESTEEMNSMAKKGLVLTNPLYSKDYENYCKEAFEEAEEGKSNLLVLYIMEEEDFKEYVEDLHLNYDKIKGKGILLNQVDVFYYTKEGDDYTEARIDQFDWKKGDVVEGTVTLTDSKKDEHWEEDFQTEIGSIETEAPMGVSSSSNTGMLILGDENVTILEDTKYTRQVYIYSSEATENKKEADQILKDYSGSMSFVDVSENTRLMESFYTLIAIFAYGFIIVIALIGVTSIFNTITTNMNLRRREFAMLKSVGMTEKEFRRMISLESFFYGMKALLIGIPLGVFLSYGVYKVMMGGTLLLPYKIPLGGIAIGAIAVMALITWIMNYSMKKINKENMIETIRNENI